MISLLSLDIVYSTQQKEYSPGNQIKTYLFERLKTKKNCSINQKKGRTFRFGIGGSGGVDWHLMWIYFLQVLPFGNL